MRRTCTLLLPAMLVAVVAPASATAPPEPLELAEVGFRLESPVAGDWAGAAIAVGDFDGDGVLDLAVGAACDGTAAPGAGATYVLYGPVTPDRSLADADAVLLGTTGDFGGEFLAALDTDGDGADELVIGAPGPVVALGPLVDQCFVLGGPFHPGFNKPGEAWVVGGGQRLDGTLDARAAADTVITGYAPADFAGWDVGGGDLDGDGNDELVVGAIGIAAFTGAAFLFPGGAMPSSASALDADAHLLGDGPSGDFGSLITAGDVDGDGIDDLLITAPSVDGSRAGTTYVFLGGALPSGAIAASSADIILEGDTGDGAGSGLAVGDLDGDGATDIVIGADVSNMTYVFYGPVDRRGTVALADADVRVSAGQARGAGGAVAVADLDGQDRSDLIIGASRDATGGPRAGAVHRLVGPLTGDIDATTTGFLLIGDAEDEAGYALAVGDVTGNGYDDLIVGAPANILAGTDAPEPGAIYIVPGEETDPEME